MTRDLHCFDQRFFNFSSDAWEEAAAKLKNKREFKLAYREYEERFKVVKELLGEQHRMDFNKLIDARVEVHTLEIDAAYMAGFRDAMKLMQSLDLAN